ncbi:MAG: RNA repair domain-containing protein [Candidatus Parvarchaeota archaeon]|nr:RNA repair domain-containing protein [Candidatus Jingweiarchaeum tengchongense]MCW1298487.1 RNA repair domain-containing protein [Candidatus Jingweiarchaeum tengchongense]MCW1300267.1 RNA repair domain-containing protein [Candidatus Jingweiarchaeum tengchongense]MCW1304499.1 RNA repair domain-containing protein [Candidatus Jingweiarchaeum tengchongense]MCW1305773.1 RNA repair domain-containing protein [Candidatus Jingweiarchaeum tengchongense]
MHPIKILLRCVYDKKYLKLDELEIVIRHRSEEGEFKCIDGGKITKVEKSGFHYGENDKEIFIPGHRIAMIRKKSGEIIAFKL